MRYPPHTHLKWRFILWSRLIEAFNTENPPRILRESSPCSRALWLLQPLSLWSPAAHPSLWRACGLFFLRVRYNDPLDVSRSQRLGRQAPNASFIGNLTSPPCVRIKSFSIPATSLCFCWAGANPALLVGSVHAGSWNVPPRSCSLRMVEEKLKRALTSPTLPRVSFV